MTRINLIDVKDLTDQHLLAEHREIKRIPNVIIKGKYNLSNKPTSYTMGTGHVKFFYDKLLFLYERYLKLYYECVQRGFNVTYYGRAFIEAKLINDSLWGYYEPTQDAISISRQRIQDKINIKKGFYTLRGVTVDR